MKKLLKIVSIAAAAVLGLGLFAGCSSGGIQEGKNGTLRVHFYVGGFDDEEMREDISDLYEQETGVRVNWIPSYTNNEIQNLLNEKTNQNDILLPQLGVWRAQDMKLLEPLNEVYEATPEGQDHTIGENMSERLYNYLLADDGNIYQMNNADSISTIVYNADVLDSFLGEENTADGWSVPNTTKELWEICDELVTIGRGVSDKMSDEMVYSFTTSSQLLYYWDYLGNVWWAQYDGYESYLNYFEGKYWDEAAQEWKMGPEINDTDGRSIALSETAKVLSMGRGYMHADCKDMGFKQAQQVLIGQGFGRNKAKAAFMVTGDWLEQEMSGALVNTKADLRMMKPPVISDIINVVPDKSIADDAELSALITYIDSVAAGETAAPTGDAVKGEGFEVTKDDYDRVSEARNMIYSATYNYPVCIPAYRPETQKELAKDFLVFYFSDRVQQIMAETNGGTVAPYGYKPDIEMSGFMKSRYDCVTSSTIVICENPKTLLSYRGGLTDMAAVGSNYVDSVLIDGKQPSTLLKESKEQLVVNWDTMLEAAGLKSAS